MCWTWPFPMPAPERHALVVPILLGLAVVLGYANALTAVFQFDDYKVIVENASLHSWQAWLDDRGQGLRGIRPLLKLSYLLNWTSGAGVVGFHVVNIAIHGINAWLVYRLTQVFLATHAAQVGVHELPFWVALVFVVHPAQTEAVTYVCGRSAALMTLFYLAALLVYAQANLGPYRRKPYTLVVPLLFLLALAVKETAITLPLALLCWEWVAGSRWVQLWRRLWMLGVTLGIVVFYFLMSSHFLAHLQRSAEFNSLPANLATQSLALTYLLRQWLLPLWLNIDPDLPVFKDFSAAGTLLGVPVLMLLVAGVSRRRWPSLSFALLWLITQVLALHVFFPRLDVVNDRQLYLAGWPLAMVLVMTLQARLTLRVARGLLGLCVLVLAILTLLRNGEYATEVTLWEATVLLSPGKPRVHNNLGYAYHLAGRRRRPRCLPGCPSARDPGDIKARYNLERLDLPQ